MKRVQWVLQLRFLFLAALLLIGLSGWTWAQQRKTPEQIVAEMSLEQKAQLVVGTGMYFPLPDSILKNLPPMFGGGNTEENDYTRMVDKTRTFVPGAAGTTAEFPGMGITSQVLADGPAGLRISPERKEEEGSFYCTAFPIATLLASSWDTDLVHQVGETMGKEVLEYGVDVILGPGLNLQRDPLCGRNFEYYSEDPLVTGKMAAAMVNGVESNGVGTSVKHFAVNNQETNRMSADVILSERALRELYLKGFEIAVTEAQPWTVMSSYNKVNGTYASESHDLLTKILRDDWGFEGYVVTDWGGGSDIVAQMVAGNDLIMPGQPSQIEALIKAVENNTLDEAILDQNIVRILEIMQKTPRYNGYNYFNNPDLKAHAQVAREAAAQGMVLLKNENKTLPFDASVKQVATFGNASFEFISGGTGSGDVNEAYTITLSEGLKAAGYKTNASLHEIYESYIAEMRSKKTKPKNFLAALMGGHEPVEEMEVTPELARRMAEDSDVAVITIGRNAGEGGDREAVEGDFYLSATEKNLITNVTQAFHEAGKKAVVVLNIAGVIETESWRDIPDAILLAWLPGQEAGHAVTDVVSGKVNPSGKLAVSFPVRYEDSSTAENFPGQAPEQAGNADDAPDLSGFSFMQRVPWEVVYEEDIYVGYRYYNTFKVPVAYPFGYGLSYTGFEYDKLKVTPGKFKGKTTVRVRVKNTGAVAGREVVQVYASAPAGRMNKPAEELVAFGKTKLLEPGESEVLKFTVETKDLASFDAANSEWIAEKGTYSIKAGASSNDIRQQASLILDKDFSAGKVTRALTPTREIDTLTRK